MICVDCRAEAAPKYRERCPRCGGELRGDLFLQNVTFSGRIPDLQEEEARADQIVASIRDMMVLYGTNDMSDTVISSESLDLWAALTGMHRVIKETDEELRARMQAHLSKPPQ